jgi:hypothetical protein
LYLLMYLHLYNLQLRLHSWGACLSSSALGLPQLHLQWCCWQSSVLVALHLLVQGHLHWRHLWLN